MRFIAAVMLTRVAEGAKFLIFTFASLAPWRELLFIKESDKAAPQEDFDEYRKYGNTRGDGRVL